MKRNLKNFVELLERKMKDHGFLFFVKNGELYRLDTVSEAPLEKVSLNKVVKTVQAWMSDEAYKATGLILPSFSLQDVASVDTFLALTCSVSENKRALLEQLILDNQMLKQMSSIPESVVCRYMQGSFNDDIAEVITHAIWHAESILEDSCDMDEDCAYPKVVDACAVQGKNGAYQVALEFRGDLTEEELYALLAMSGCFYERAVINIVPVKADEFGTAEFYIQSWEEKEWKGQSISINVSGGSLVASVIPDEAYPGISISFRPKDGSAETYLAVVEESDSLLYVRSYSDTEREDPDSFQCRYNPDMLAHIIYGLCEADTEGIPFSVFCSKKLTDRDYMRKVLPENLFAEYDQTDFSTLKL